MSPSVPDPEAAPEPAPAESGMTLGEHLDELRVRLFKGVIAVVICFIAAWLLRDQAYEVFMGPFEKGVGMLREDWLAVIEERLVDDPETPRTEYFLTSDPSDQRLLPGYAVEERPLVTGVGEGFMVKLKVSLYFALFVGGPYLLWQLWAFIAAGLYKHERKVVLSFFPTSILLFFSGVVFGYFVLVPYGMYYLSGELQPDQGWIGFKLDTYLTFISGLCLSLGLVFQLPIILTALARVGLVAPSTFAHYRGHFALASFILAAILTPPDPITQSMMAGPMIVLYEVGIWSARIAARNQRKAEVPAT
ncbi:MAG: twin-arginine translocase subunit TatC [Planctomycetota bacterium]|nr:twin-arginine translocase subunit TatC [Planctomycetota bacterium]